MLHMLNTHMHDLPQLITLDYTTIMCLKLCDDITNNHALHSIYFVLVMHMHTLEHHP